MVQVVLKLLLKQRILAVHHDFHRLLVSTKLLAAKLHSCYAEESESENLERSGLESNILPPTPQPCIGVEHIRLRNPALESNISDSATLHWRTTWSTVCSSAPHSQTAEEDIPHLYKQERKRPTPVRRWLSRTQALLGLLIKGGWVPVSGIKGRSPGVFCNHSASHRSYIPTGGKFLMKNTGSCALAGVRFVHIFQCF